MGGERKGGMEPTLLSIPQRAAPSTQSFPCPQRKEPRDQMALVKYYSLLLLLLLMAAVLMKPCHATLEEDEKECADQLQNLASCVPYVSGSAPKPTPECCADAEKVRASQPKLMQRRGREQRNTISIPLLHHWPSLSSREKETREERREIRRPRSTPKAGAGTPPRPKRSEGGISRGRAGFRRSSECRGESGRVRRRSEPWLSPEMKLWSWRDVRRSCPKQGDEANLAVSQSRNGSGSGRGKTASWDLLMGSMAGMQDVSVIGRPRTEEADTGRVGSPALLLGKSGITTTWGDLFESVKTF